MVTVKMNIKKLHPLAQTPAYETRDAAGFDLASVEDVVINPGETVLIPTGLAVQVDPNCELQIRPRSGMSLKTTARIANSPGTIDADYRGEVKIIMENIGDNPLTINAGDRIAQGVVAPVFRVEFDEVEELDDTARGAGGFGSTG